MDGRLGQGRLQIGRRLRQVGNLEGRKVRKAAVHFAVIHRFESKNAMSSALRSLQRHFISKLPLPLVNLRRRERSQHPLLVRERFWRCIRGKKCAVDFDPVKEPNQRAFGGELRSGKAQDYTRSHLLRDKIVSGLGYFQQRWQRLARDTA